MFFFIPGLLGFLSRERAFRFHFQPFADSVNERSYRFNPGIIFVVPFYDRPGRIEGTGFEQYIFDG